MKKLLVKIFKELLNVEVRVINIPQDNIDMGIFVIHNKKMRKMNEKLLAEQGFDYAITRSGENTIWVYLQAINIDAVIQNNKVISPSETIISESIQMYRSSEKAFIELIKSIIEEKSMELIREWEIYQ